MLAMLLNGAFVLMASYVVKEGCSNDGFRFNIEFIQGKCNVIAFVKYNGTNYVYE